MNAFEHLLTENKSFKFKQKDFNEVNGLYRVGIDDDIIVAWIEDNISFDAPWTAKMVFKEFKTQKGAK